LTLAKLLASSLLAYTYIGAPFAICASAAEPSRSTIWMFDRLDNVGGLTTHIEGNPTLINTSAGKAMKFDGINDAIFVDAHPLSGAKTFTFEAIFRPDGGATEQRWFHLASLDPQTGLYSVANGTKDPNPRMTFELRVVNNDSWYLVAFTHGDGYTASLQAHDKLYPIGRWYDVVQTYDGHMYRSYVNGELQAEAQIDFKPQGLGHTSVGTRMNHVNYFNGAILEARFTPESLSPDQFLKVPIALSSRDPTFK
jgi:hypothetical protein